MSTEVVAYSCLFGWLARPLQYVFLLQLIPWIEQGRSELLVMLLYDLCDGLTIFNLLTINVWNSILKTSRRHFLKNIHAASLLKRWKQIKEAKNGSILNSGQKSAYDGDRTKNLFFRFKTFFRSHQSTKHERIFFKKTQDWFTQDPRFTECHFASRLAKIKNSPIFKIFIRIWFCVF